MGIWIFWQGNRSRAKTRGAVLYLGLGNSEFQRQGEIGGYDRITDGAGMRAYAVATISDHAFLTPGGLLLESYDTRTGAVTGDVRIGVQPWVSGGKPFFSDFDGDTSPEVIGLAETSLIVVRQAEPSILLSTEELSLTHDFISRSHASVHYGDFDADGYVDVLTMHERLGELKPAIRWGSPRGLTGPVDANFAETGFQLAGGFETRVEPEDGHPDILVNAMYGGEQGAVILEGSDDRTFSFRFDPGTILGKKDTLVAFGDIDGDGLMDRVSSLESSNRILLAQRGLHSDIDIEMQFDEGVHYKTEIEIGGDFTVSLGSQLSLADVTGDGVLDVLHTTNSSHVSVLPGISPFQPGDVNRDDVLDATDISILTANQDADVSSLYRLDMTGDQIVNQNDVDHWLESIVGTRRGDLDLDGDVDFADFLTLSANFGATEAVWSDGDFDGDGVVAFADFLVLSANFGFDRDIGE